MKPLYSISFGKISSRVGLHEAFPVPHPARVRSYLKHDACGSKAASYPDMRDALNETGRHIYYSIHGPKRAGAIANCWRTTGDISNSWGSIVERALDNSQDGNREASGPGAFNDPDMLETGNLWGPLGDAEGRSHFSMWAVMKAPLLLGTDVTHIPGCTGVE